MRKKRIYVLNEFRQFEQLNFLERYPGASVFVYVAVDFVGEEGKVLSALYVQGIA